LALLGLLAVIVMVFAWILTSRLNAANRYVALDRGHNAKVMSRAKAALIGHMAQKAAMTGENNPGSLPCPEAPADFNVPGAEGTANGNCSLPAVGRLPWRTIGVEKLVDAAGEPLWYAVSPGWAFSGTQTVINPDTIGQLTVDGAANDAVALIIAPGPAVVVPAAAGCTAWSQARPASGAPDKRNYVECGNATNSFVSSSANASFNDQILRVTVADVMPALEAAIQERAQREIAPALRDAAFALDSNSPRRWVSSTSNPPIYPYAVRFDTSPDASNFRGDVGFYQGLLPMASVSGFVDFESTPGNATKTTAAGSINSQNCYPESSTVYACEGEYEEDGSDPSLPISLRMTATFNNVAMGLRSRNVSKLTAEARNSSGDSWSTASVSVSRRLEMNDGGTSGKPHGSVTARIDVTLPNIDAMGWNTVAQFRIRMDRDVIGNHCLLATTTTACPSGGPDTSWFARNLWHRNFYYAVADQNTPTVLPGIGGCDSSDCLRINDETNRNVRVLLVLAGRRLPTQTRPSATLANYLEYDNKDGLTHYEQRRPRFDRVANASLNLPWNDRLVLVDWDPANPPVPSASGPQVTSLSPGLRIYTVP
jgi:hypothetical protein